METITIHCSAHRTGKTVWLEQQLEEAMREGKMPIIMRARKPVIVFADEVDLEFPSIPLEIISVEPL